MFNINVYNGSSYPLFSPSLPAPPMATASLVPGSMPCENYQGGPSEVGPASTNASGVVSMLQGVMAGLQLGEAAASSAPGSALSPAPAAAHHKKHKKHKKHGHHK